MKCKKWTDQHGKSMGQKRIQVPDRNQTHDLLNTCQVLWGLKESKVNCVPYVTGVLHSTRISTVEVIVSATSE